MPRKILTVLLVVVAGVLALFGAAFAYAQTGIAKQQIGGAVERALNEPGRTANVEGIEGLIPFNVRTESATSSNFSIWPSTIQPFTKGSLAKRSSTSSPDADWDSSTSLTLDELISRPIICGCFWPNRLSRKPTSEGSSGAPDGREVNKALQSYQQDC